MAIAENQKRWRLLNAENGGAGSKLTLAYELGATLFRAIATLPASDPAKGTSAANLTWRLWRVRTSVVSEKVKKK